MTTGIAWITANLATAPAQLREVMTRALELSAEDAPSADTAESLGRAARALYQDVIDGEGKRDDALTLLAADALLTHAFQVRAETDPDALPGFAGRFGGRGEIGLLAERAAGGSR